MKLLLACAAALAVASPVLANPSAVTTFESAGLYWKPSVRPGAEGCAVRYRKAGESAWKEGLALWYDARNQECRGSLVHLSPGTSYDIELTAGSQRATLAARTWSEQFPIAKTVKITGAKRALAITEGGSAKGYVVYDGTNTQIDGADAEDFNITVEAPYVIVRGFTLKGARQDAIRILEGAHDVVIEDNDISGWGRRREQDGRVFGMDMDSGVRAVCKKGNLERVVVQRNRIHDPRYSANSWSFGHPLGPQGVTISFCGGNHVIRYNDITGSDGHYFNDAIGGEDNFTATGFPNADSDIYGNLITHAWDDGIEAEGGDRNVRIWGNYIDRTATGVATTVAHVGPVYIWRNVYNRSRTRSEQPPDQDDRNGFAKSGTTSEWGGGRRYVFHNTLLQATASGNEWPLGAGGGIYGTGKNQPVTNTVSRNNIFQIWKPHWNAIGDPGSGNDFAYDLYNSNPGATIRNGFKGVAVYAKGNGWKSESGGQYQLSPDSPGFDKGERIPNFNDSFTGAGPDVGAHEAGTPPMRFGVKAAAPAQ